MGINYKGKYLGFFFFYCRDEMCFPSHNSSQGKQFSLAEFSKIYIEGMLCGGRVYKHEMLSTLKGLKV